MKITIHREHLGTALAHVKRAAQGTTSMPILRHVLLEAEPEGRLRLTCDNLDFSLSCRVLADVREPGALALPARQLLAVVKDSSGSTVTIEDEGNLAKVVSGEAEFEIPKLDEDAFPQSGFAAAEFPMWRTDLRRMVNRVRFAQSQDENRYLLNGVFFARVGGEVTTVATDGKIIARAGGTTSEKVEGKGEFIVHAEGVEELRRLLGDSGKIMVSSTDKAVSFRVPVLPEKPWISDLRLIARRVDGNYPNYQQVLVIDHPHKANIERERLLWAVKRGALATSETMRQLRVTFRLGAVEVEAHSVNGSAKEIVPAKYDGPEVFAAFNPEYLLPPLEALEDPVVELLIKDGDSIFFIQDAGFLCGMMPQRIG